MKSEHAARLSQLLKELASLVEDMVDTADTPAAPKPVAKKKAAKPAPEPVAAEPVAAEPVAAPDPTPPGTGNGAAPFHDGKGLLTYVSESFKLMGAEKGQKIGDILSELGVQSVTAVSPEMYGQFYAKVEELKNA